MGLGFVSFFVGMVMSDSTDDYLKDRFDYYAAKVSKIKCRMHYN
jgi:hypothetical protein